jgi:membrane protein
VVVFLIWLSWNVNAIFFGGALATEVEISIDAHEAQLALADLRGVSWLYSEWTWASLFMTLGMSLIYRWAMSRRPVNWRASLLGGLTAAILCLFASWATAFYVEQIAHLGATYGSIATVVVFLIWLSWNVNAIFFGGALATEVEIAIDAHTVRPLIVDARGAKPMVSPPGS